MAGLCNLLEDQEYVDFICGYRVSNELQYLDLGVGNQGADSIYREIWHLSNIGVSIASFTLTFCCRICTSMPWSYWLLLLPWNCGAVDGLVSACWFTVTTWPQCRLSTQAPPEMCSCRAACEKFVFGSCARVWVTGEALQWSPEQGSRPLSSSALLR